jgi:undecaprenyl-diphosphatase
MSIFRAILLAIEDSPFLPVSSTGHMIIGSSLFGIASIHSECSPLPSVWCYPFRDRIILEKIMPEKQSLRESFTLCKLLVACTGAAILGFAS